MNKTNKEIALGLIHVINSRKVDSIVEYYSENINYESYFKQPDRRLRMTYGYINEEYHTKDDHLRLLRKIWNMHNEFFPTYEYKINKEWVIEEDAKILIPTTFQNQHPFSFKNPLPITWYIHIKEGKLFKSGFFGHPLETYDFLISSTDIKNEKQIIDSYIQQLIELGLIK